MSLPAFDRKPDHPARLSTDSFNGPGIETNSSHRQTRNRENQTTISSRDVRQVKRVTFNLERNQVYWLPEEDRTSPWLTMAVDRCRFQARIRAMEQLLDPILNDFLQKLF